ncbi:hypothetical protein BC834DRAFT_876741 [Gloeopeniophorella convolvens]|nr:hypothetical protein BC834DRAFT_876741 [Gloeopeniophorella convolvens]
MRARNSCCTTTAPVRWHSRSRCVVRPRHGALLRAATARQHGVPTPASPFPHRSLTSTAPSSRTRTVVRAVLVFDSPPPPLHDRTRAAYAVTPRALACCAEPPPCSNEHGPTPLTEDAVLFPPFSAGHAAARETHGTLLCARRKGCELVIVYYSIKYGPLYLLE